MDQGTATAPEGVTDTTDEFPIDPSSMIGQESINWTALRDAVHAAVQAHSGYATLPEVLACLPEARVGDVIGLWSLATRYGDVDDRSRSVVWAHTARGLREITIPYAVFANSIPDPASPAVHPRSLSAQLTLAGDALDG